MSTPSKSIPAAFAFRPMQESDVDGVVELIKIEEWFIVDRLSMDIARQKLTTFYAIVDSANDEKVIAIACVSITRGEELMLGNVIVHKGHRGQGLGTYMIRQVLSLHSDSIVTWFSAADPFYISLGYQRCEQAAVVVQMALNREKVKAYCQENALEDTISITSYTEARWEDFVCYDAHAKGYENKEFLTLVTKVTDKIALAVSGSEQRIVGYVAICKNEAGKSLFFNGFYADSDRIAAALFSHAQDTFPDVDWCRLFTLASRQFVLQFGQSIQAANQSRFAATRMPAKIPEAKVYCLSQPDLSY